MYKAERARAEQAASLIWNLVNDHGQDALSHVDYADIISRYLLGADTEPMTARAQEYIVRTEA